MHSLFLFHLIFSTATTVACTKYHFFVFLETEKQHKGETEIQVESE